MRLRQTLRIGALAALAIRAGDGRAAETPFGPEVTISASATGASWIEAADIDRDGRPDFVYAVEGQDKIAWRRNTDGLGAPGPEQTINAAASGPYCLAVGDIDRDGDLDVIYASRSGNKIAWHANTNGLGAFSAENAIPGSPMSCRRVKLADIDRDGDLDALSASDADGVIAWYPNDGAGAFASQQVITSAAAGTHDVEVGDIERDGDLDVLYPAAAADEIRWQANNGAGVFGAPTTISNTVDLPRDVEPAVVRLYGWIDVFSASLNDDKIAVRGNDGFGAYGAEALWASPIQATTVRAADLDNDADLDVLWASDGGDAVAWSSTDDPGGGQIAAAADVHCIAVADVDGDGDRDILYAASGGALVAWRRNLLIHRSAVFGPEHVMPTPYENPTAIYAVELNRDGKMDALVVDGPPGVIRKHDGLDGLGAFGSGATITSSVDYPTRALFADLDRDGDPDIAYATANDDKIAWQPNTNAYGTFGAQQVLPAAVDSGQDIAAADLDRDGTIDLVWASMNTNKIGWNSNNGAGTFAADISVTTALAGARAIGAEDIDRDGDIDVVGAAFAGNALQLFRNNGAGSFAAGSTITSSVNQPAAVALADVDRDGDADVISASRGDDKIAWHPNDGAGSFGAQQAMTTAADGAESVWAVDLDHDGDPDAVIGSGADGKIAWQENTNGAGSFAAPTLVNQLASPITVFASSGDIDDDGDQDILFAGMDVPLAGWHENCGGQYALAATSTAPATIPEYARAAVLKIQMIHRGRTGDTDAELAQLHLRIEDGAGGFLTDPQANALVETIYIYLDDGSGIFEEASDTQVASVGPPLLSAGDYLLVPLADGDPNARVPFGSPKTFFVVAQVAPDAPNQSPNAFRVVLADEYNVAEDADHDFALAQECAALAVVASGSVTTVAGPTPTPTLTPTLTPTESPTPSASPTATSTPSRTPSPTASRTPSQTASMTASQTPSRTPSPTPSRTPSPTASQTASMTPSQTASRTPSQTPSRTPSQTASRTPSQTPSATPSLTASMTASQTPSRTPSVSPSTTPSATPSRTASATASPTASATASATTSPTSTATPSATASPTISPSPSISPTPTATPTASLSPTPNAAWDWTIYE